MLAIGHLSSPFELPAVVELSVVLDRRLRVLKMTLTSKNASNRKRKRDAVESGPSPSTRAVVGLTLAGRTDKQTTLLWVN